jgi:hypothetical protein
MNPGDLYQTMIARGFVPYIAQPRAAVNACRGALGLPPYRALGGWLPPRRKGRRGAA